MFDALRRLLRQPTQHSEEDEQLGLRQAVAALLYEMTRMDLEVRAEDLSAARGALSDLFGMTDDAGRDLLHQASEAANRLTSYHDAVSAINRHFDAHTKIRLVEHLWRVAYADSNLDLHEDHLARKISDLLYVPHVQSMLARQRVREGLKS